MIGIQQFILFMGFSERLGNSFPPLQRAKFFAAASHAKIRVWDALTGALFGIFGGYDTSSCFGALSLESALVSVSDGMIRLENIDTGAACGMLDLDDLGKAFLASAPDGQLVAASAASEKEVGVDPLRCRTSWISLGLSDSRLCKPQGLRKHPGRLGCSPNPSRWLGS